MMTAAAVKDEVEGEVEIDVAAELGSGWTTTMVNLSPQWTSKGLQMRTKAAETI
jgi:hypothetical protein